MDPTEAPDELAQRTFRTQRSLAHAPQTVFDAFASADVLARWWGPAGFTNVFETCEFRPGGRWKYVMHAPGGTHHPNESVFEQIAPPSRVVIRHVSKPTYVLTIGLEPHGGGTLVTWAQLFDDAGVSAKIRHIVEPANEQNLDRLQAVLDADSGPPA